jgi:hypothetical protein
MKSGFALLYEDTPGFRRRVAVRLHGNRTNSGGPADTRQRNPERLRDEAEKLN